MVRFALARCAVEITWLLRDIVVVVVVVVSWKNPICNYMPNINDTLSYNYFETTKHFEN